MALPRSAGGWDSIRYTLARALESGPLRMWRSLRARNACKTCALGMGGQLGGMVNEQGRFPEFCKKSVQAMAADLQPGIPATTWEALPFEALERLSSRELERLGRLTTPLVAERDASRYRAAAWDEALARITAHLRATSPDRSFFYFSGRSSNEAAFLLQLFARLYGTNNVNNCSYYCHQASGVGLSSVLGQGTGTIAVDDLDAADLVFLVGANPASNHPRLMRALMDLKRRGGTVVVVNPLRETGLVSFSVPSDVRSLLFGTRIADFYLTPHVGGDIALFTALATLVAEREDGADTRFLEQHASGWPELRRHLAAQDVEGLAARAGVALNEIRAVADAYCRSRATVFAWTMGITHHRHGVDNVRAIANLALLRGMCGRAGAGLLPLRGHSNVQGLGTVGVTPRLKDEIFSRLQARFGVTLPTAQGLDTMACVERAAAGGIAAAWCLGGNLLASNPDTAFAGRAMGAIEQVVYLSTALNTGHVHGRGRETWILPVLARDEEPQPTTQESSFSYVRLSDGGPRRHAGPLSEVQVVSALARRVLPPGPVDWAGLESHGRIRETIAAVVPGLSALADIDRTRREFTIPGRTIRSPRFATPDGRARLHVVAIPDDPPLGERELRLTTVRSEGQFNSVVYEEHDRYRGTERRDVILISPDDRRRLGLAVDELVTVRSVAGEMHGVRVREFPVRSGNAAMYYPEANAIVPRVVDPESRTPAFKHVRVTLTPAVGRAPSS